MKKLIQIIKWYLLTRCKYSYFTSRTKLIAWQNKKAQQIVKFAIENSAFYQRFYAGYNLSDWEALPELNKQLLVENFSELNTAQIDFATAYEVAIKAETSRDFSPAIGNVTVGLSSGTSGSRGLFLANKDEQLAWAGTVLAKMLPANIFIKQKIAFFLRANNNLYTTLNSAFIKFEFYDLLCDVANHIERLNHFTPTILVAPPSMLRMLADAKNNDHLIINPKKIISVAEVLEPSDRRFIESAFKQTVHQIYQATEGFIAATCQYGTLHLNEDVVIVQKEYIDASKKKFIPIITDMYRATQPIIRYKLNDILTESSETCPCGSIYTAIEQVDGRCDDLLYLSSINTAKPIPIFPDFIRRAIITSTAESIEYSVVQNDLSSLQLNIKCNSDIRAETQEQIGKAIATLCHELSVVCARLEFGVYVPPKPGEKLRRIIRKFSVETS